MVTTEQCDKHYRSQELQRHCNLDWVSGGSVHGNGQSQFQGIYNLTEFSSQYPYLNQFFSIYF